LTSCRMVDNRLLSSATCSGVNVTGSVGRAIANYAPEDTAFASEHLIDQLRPIAAFAFVC
jgi:hypothetical protein